MSNKPLLGGFCAKVANAYLLPSTSKRKKKIKSQLFGEVEEAEKAANSIAEMIVMEKCAELLRRVQSGDLGGGWDPNNQQN